MHLDEELLTWATGPAQIDYLKAVNEHGSYRAGAKALGIGEDVVRKSLNALIKRAAAQGYSPAHSMTKTVPDPFVVKGVSTYFDADGKPRGQWVKSSLDEQKFAAAKKAALEALAETLPRLDPIAAPKVTSAALCNLYTMTDCHMGMLAWHKEGGADWDIKIAERVLSECFEHMVMASPAAGTCVVAQLGDFLHSDGLMPVTPTSGHILDQDGRFAKVVQASIRVLRRLVDFALTRHQRVIVLMAEGNHDLASSVWLRAMFKALYEREPRVEVIESELPYYVQQHGSTMLAFHHGHLKKNEQLPLTFAAQFPRTWGATVKRYCHTGHRHHTEEKEHAGMTVVQHPTLAARDAYAARGGWIAERQVTSMTYHDQWGLVARHTVCPEMVEAAGKPSPQQLRAKRR